MVYSVKHIIFIRCTVGFGLRSLRIGHVYPLPHHHPQKYFVTKKHEKSENSACRVHVNTTEHPVYVFLLTRQYILSGFKITRTPILTLGG